MENTNYPLASLVVVFYKQEKFVRETVEGALSQTYPNLEIILSDDNSPDGTFEEIQKAVKDYNGPHKIIVNRNEMNMGLVPHNNKAMFELSHGEFLFVNGGDDISMPKRIETGVNYFLDHPDASSLSFSYDIINQDGKITGEFITQNDVFTDISDYSYLSSPSFMTRGIGLALRREVLETFGELNGDAQTEDSTLRFRALLMGFHVWLACNGMKYRVHDNNISKHIFRLKTDKIARQYEKDLECARNRLSSCLFQILKKKIEYYKKNRSLEELYAQSGKIKKILIIFQKWYHRRVYLCTIKQINKNGN